MDRNKVFTQNDIPERDPDADGQFSLDVIVRSTKTGMYSIGFYDYHDEEWDFHNDTMEDLTEFKWMYAPQQLHEVYTYEKKKK